MRDLEEIFIEKFNEAFNPPGKEQVDARHLGGLSLLTGKHEKIELRRENKGSIIGQIDDDGKGWMATIKRWSVGENIVINHSEYNDDPYGFKQMSDEEIMYDEIPQAKEDEPEALPEQPNTEEDIPFPAVNPAYKHLYAIYDLILKSSIKPRKELALGASLAAMAAVAAKARVCYKGARISGYPCLFVAISAPTGEGKDNPRSVVEEILVHPSVGAYGSGDYRSAPGLMNSIDDGIPVEGEDDSVKRKETHIRLDISDEFIELFRRTNQDNAPAHQKALSDVLCRLFSAPGKTLGLGRYASPKDAKESIASPCISYLGSATVKDLENNLTMENLEKGLLSRFLFFTSTHQQDYVLEGDVNKCHGVESIAESLGGLIAHYNRTGKGRDRYSWMQLEVSDCANEFIRKMYSDQGSEMHAAGDNEIARAILSRRAELAMRIAVILVVSREGLELTAEDVKAGLGIVKWCHASSRSMLQSATSGSGSERDIETLRKRILEMIGQNKKGRFAYDKEIRRRSRKLTSRPGYFEHLISALIKDSSISKIESKNGRVGYTDATLDS